MCCPRGEESMSLGPRIEAAGSMSNVGPILKAGCTSGIGGIMLASNTSGIAASANIDAFLGS